VFTVRSAVDPGSKLIGIYIILPSLLIRYFSRKIHTYKILGKYPSLGRVENELMSGVYIL